MWITAKAEKLAKITAPVYFGKLFIRNYQTYFNKMAHLA